VFIPYLRIGAQELKFSSSLDSWVQLSPEQCAIPNIATLSPWVSVARRDERPERGGFGDKRPCRAMHEMRRPPQPDPTPACKAPGFFGMNALARQLGALFFDSRSA